MSNGICSVLNDGTEGGTLTTIEYQGKEHIFTSEYNDDTTNTLKYERFVTSYKRIPSNLIDKLDGKLTLVCYKDKPYDICYKTSLTE